MKYIDLILPLLKGLGTALKNLFLGFFLIKVGKDKENLQYFEHQEKQIEKSKKLKSNLDSKSRKSKRNILLNDNEPK